MVKPGGIVFWLVCWLFSSASVLGDDAVSGLPPELEEMIADALDSANVTACNEALCALDRMGAKALSVVPALIERLADDPQPRWPDEDLPAVTALDAIGDPAVESLLKVAVESGHPGRAGAIRALGKIGHEHALPRLVSALQDDDAQVRRSAAWALGKIKHEWAAPALIAALGHEDPEMRCTAVWALSRTGGTGSTAAVTESLSDDDPAVRAAAAAALGELGRLGSLDVLPALLNDADPSVVDAADEAIQKLERVRDKKIRSRKR